MLVNPNIDLEKTLFDCLIIGAGPAGICAALKLANDKKKVLLIEGGDFEETDLSRSIYEGNIIGDPYPPLENLRARLFGGTLKQYSHCLRFFDETDKFIVDGDDFSLRTSLNKFHKESLEHFYTDDFQEDREIENSNFKFFRYIFSSRKNYTVKNLKEKILKNQNIYLSLNSNLKKINTDGNSVTNVEIIDYEKNIKKLKAKRYILSCGCLENSRILLYNQILNNKTLIKNDETLGKYFTEHPETLLGEVVIWNYDLINKYKNNPPNGFAYFARSNKELKKGKLNHAIKIFNHRFHAKNEIIKKRFNIKSIEALNKICSGEIKNNLLYEKACDSVVVCMPEIAPSEKNKITLSDSKKDFFGAPKINLYLDTKKTRDDLKEFAMDFGKFLIKKDMGRMRIAEHIDEDLNFLTINEDDTHSITENNKLIDLKPSTYPYTYCGHHMGGTRISVDSKNGIVDENLKLHDQNNFYVLGSSVFYKTGWANPTYTIINMAMRLADHINKTL